LQSSTSIHHRLPHSLSTTYHQTHLGEFFRPSRSEVIDTYGDFPHPNKPQGNLRILFSNINGLSTVHTDQDCHHIGTVAKTHQIECLGLVEPNINWTNVKTTTSVKKVFQKYWTKTLLKTSSTPTQHTGVYQPGGTLSLLADNWTGGSRVYEDTSGLGRWTELRIQGRQNRQLSIITTYRVPQTSISTADPNTSYYHQWHHLRRQCHPNPDPRSQVLQDLGDHIQALQAEYHAIIVMIDANESYTDKNSSLQSWLTRHSLKDVHMHLHQHDTTISTYSRGHKRIDYMFATDNIISYVVSLGLVFTSGI